MDKPIIVLWTHPRSASTAFERVMLEIGGSTVLHEPFSHLYYFEKERAQATAHIENKCIPRSYDEIKNSILNESKQRTVFVKDMAYHAYDYLVSDPDFLARIHSTFLIRNPQRSIPSHFKINPKVSLEEIGYEKAYLLAEKIFEVTGKKPFVMEAEALIAHPKLVIKIYCELLGVQYKEDALQWKSGHVPEWDAWKGWHKTVSETTEISDVKTVYKEDIHNSDLLKSYYEYHLPYYLQLKKFIDC